MKFKEINDFPNYEVSDTGLVRNKRKNRLKEPGKDCRGYLKVDLYKNSKRYTRKIHRLVAEAFIPNESPSYRREINHIDGNKQNNSVENLEWCTGSENMRHAIRIGLYTPKPSRGMLGRKNPNAGSKGKSIRVVETGKHFKSIVACEKSMNGVRAKAITDCLHGRQKTHRGYHFEFL